SFAVAPVVGQNFGGRRGDRVRRSIYSAIGIGSVMMLLLTIIAQFSSAAMIRAFSKDPAVIAFGSDYLRIVSVNFVFAGIAFTTSSAFQGIGNTLPPLISSMTRLILFALPATLLSFHPGFQIRHVWYLSVGSIILLDMDCFYAAIEVRDRPSLRGKPVGVGGARDRRGVLTTCNYEARAFGVRSAMPTFMALQRCPNLIVLPTRFDVYRKEAGVVREIMHRFTPLVETLSLDEAYLDVTDNRRSPGPLAREMRDLIFKETKLTASAGIGPNKM